MGAEIVKLGRRAMSKEEHVDWQAVYREELPRVYNYFRYRLGDGPAAQDLTADTFERAWRSRNHYRADLAGFRTWLTAIARNRATDYLRRQREQVSLEAVRDLPGEERVDEEVQHRQNLAQLARLLEGLDDRERDIIALKYGAGCSHREIARTLGLSSANVGVILFRTLRKLRREWEELT